MAITKLNNNHKEIIKSMPQYKGKYEGTMEFPNPLIGAGLLARGKRNRTINDLVSDGKVYLTPAGRVVQNLLLES